MTNELEIGLGSIEMSSLKPAKVKIIDAKVELVKDKLGKEVGKKVTFTAIHPDKKENINISSVKYEKKGSLEVSGLWFVTDAKNEIQKGSALYALLSNKGATSVKAMIGMEIDTILDERGYLCLKGY
jgi:hypothetical protein